MTTHEVIGMTMKQFYRAQFYETLESYRKVRGDMSPEGKQAFILLSIRLHILKGRVPKRMWLLINK